jgi:hypothetical protein
MEKDEKGYTPLTFDEYNESFCDNEDMMKEAYKRAWETRNFEIDKFWLRTAFFWGFIAIIFGGYITVMTSDNSEKLLSMNFDIYLVLLGIVFSVAWLLVIIGSKNWQENWEAHIDMLEDKITGPLYKTINCPTTPYYSVSKINIFLSVLIIIVWVIILLQNLFFVKSIDEINCHIIFALLLTIIIIFLLLILCRTGNGIFKIKKSIRKKLKNNDDGLLTRFINRWE